MATTDEVHIYLPIPSSNGNMTEWIHILSIPRNAIERLSLRPLKWLRFATFAVCGAKGYFTATEGGEMLDHENVSFNNLAHKYYYVPQDDYHLVDSQVFNDRVSSSTNISRRSGAFRQRICERDSSRCVFTRRPAPACNAAHIIPKSRGSKYITFVVQDRASLYERLPTFGEKKSKDVMVDINCVQNGILLRKDLHVMFGTAEIVFLKTPNFALAPADIPLAEQGRQDILNSRITIQYLGSEPSDEFAVIPQLDAGAHWSNKETSPPSILLDFMFGAAIVKYWMSDDLKGMLQERFQRDYARALEEDSEHSIPEPEDDDNDDDVGVDDPKGDDREPPQKGKHKGKHQGRKACSPTSAGLLDAMDSVLCLSMLLKGVTPEMVVAEGERREREKEQCSREHSCKKVEEWLSWDA